jgi:hypothetical protein
MGRGIDHPARLETVKAPQAFPASVGTQKEEPS